MPSDHTSIAARHRARTLSRAKSLRKHQRWLDQQSYLHQSQIHLLHVPDGQRRYQSQPNLTLEHFPEFKQRKWYDSHWQHAEKTFGILRRTMSLNLKRESESLVTKAEEISDTEVGSSSDDLPFPHRPHAHSKSTRQHSRTHSNKSQTQPFAQTVVPFPWKEFAWNSSKRNLGVSTGKGKAGSMLTPYPATTTRSVSKVGAPARPIRVREGKIMPEANAFRVLKAVRFWDDKVHASSNKVGKKANNRNAVAVTAASKQNHQPRTTPRSRSATVHSVSCEDRNDSSTSTTTDATTNTTSSSSAESSSRFIQLLARPLPPISDRFNSPPRAQTFTYPPRSHSMPATASKPKSASSNPLKRTWAYAWADEMREEHREELRQWQRAELRRKMIENGDLDPSTSGEDIAAKRQSDWQPTPVVASKSKPGIRRRVPLANQRSNTNTNAGQGGSTGRARLKLEPRLSHLVSGVEASASPSASTSASSSIRGRKEMPAPMRMSMPPGIPVRTSSKAAFTTTGTSSNGESLNEATFPAPAEALGGQVPTRQPDTSTNAAISDSDRTSQVKTTPTPNPNSRSLNQKPERPENKDKETKDKETKDKNKKEKEKKPSLWHRARKSISTATTISKAKVKSASKNTSKVKSKMLSFWPAGPKRFF